MRKQNGASLGCWKYRCLATLTVQIKEVAEITGIKEIKEIKGIARIHCARWIALACLLMAFGGAPPRSGAQGLGQDSRVVQGKVLNPQGNHQPDAIVYLQNQKTLEVKTYITTEDGSYRFGELSTDADYQVWAKYRALKSKTRSISSFDSKQQIIFDLKLEPSKPAK